MLSLTWTKTKGFQIDTVIVSCLKRERDRTVNVFDYSFQSVTEFRLESS
jgi:hypothetical protein